MTARTVQPKTMTIFGAWHYLALGVAGRPPFEKGLDQREVFELPDAFTGDSDVNEEPGQKVRRYRDIERLCNRTKLHDRSDAAHHREIGLDNGGQPLAEIRQELANCLQMFAGGDRNGRRGRQTIDPPAG